MKGHLQNAGLANAGILEELPDRRYARLFRAKAILESIEAQ